jgi:hypothetical protein
VPKKLTKNQILLLRTALAEKLAEILQRGDLPKLIAQVRRERELRKKRKLEVKRLQNLEKKPPK